jgi:hypothetical protein
MRHKIDSASGAHEFFFDDGVGIGSVMLGFLSLITGLLGLFVVGMPLTALLGQWDSDWSIGLTLGILIGFFAPILWVVVVPLFHIYHGLDRVQTQRMQQYFNLPARARKELPRPTQVRNTILEADSDELYEVERAFSKLHNSAKAMDDADARLSPKQRSFAVESLVNHSEDVATSLNIMAKEYTRVAKELN